MEIGIFSRTYEYPSLEEVFQKMTSQGIYHTQFNLISAGMETLPDYVDDRKLELIKTLADQYGVNLTAVSATFNMIDPDENARKDGIRRFEIVCRYARQLGIPIVTLCTGSKNPRSKWEWHPDNDLPSSWKDLMVTTEMILKSAEDNDVVLGVEPEASNIIHSPEIARKYLDAVGSKRLKIIMDGANLFRPNQIVRMQETLREAFDYLGKDIVLAHAKDLAKNDGIAFVAAGEGILDFAYYIRLLKESGYQGPLIMHGLSEEQVPSGIQFLKGAMS